MFLYISLFVLFFYGLFEENVHRLSVIYVTLYNTSFYFLQTLLWLYHMLQWIINILPLVMVSVMYA
jgi:hypothetical protein